ncbi:hypothetical protein RND81_13G061100 [Saponaria officinalis]|uniref:Uncharacterized protein n=1 Tax=Saponaria officinalis TaxID=3572 RepID=A0AAW1GUG9_SAPOF
MIPVAVTLKQSPLRIHLPVSYGGSSSPLQFQFQFMKAKNKRGVCICRAELLHEAPFSIAIGASILNTLLFTPSHPVDVDAEDASTDARLAVMSIISFIPFFNWLSWVFALMDTGHPRYAVYALVYLAPYLRTNLSLSPDDSWLPISSIFLCVLHIQLEASITSGDLESFNFFNEIGKRLGFINLKKDIRPNSLRKKHQQETKPNHMNLPSSDEKRKWKVPIKPSEDVEHVNEDDATKH